MQYYNYVSYLTIQNKQMLHIHIERIKRRRL